MSLFLAFILIQFSSPDPNPVCKVRSADTFYSEMDISSLRTQSSTAKDVQRNYILYRLFPISKDHDDIQQLASDIPDGSAEDLAVLSALWAFRSQKANPINWIRYVRRSDGLLKRALSIDRNDPLVSLIDAQALFYKPKIAGGGKQKSLDRLKDLRSRIQDASSCTDFVKEVDIWIWTVTKDIDEYQAEKIKQSLLKQNLSKVHRRYLLTT